MCIRDRQPYIHAGEMPYLQEAYRAMNPQKETQCKPKVALVKPGTVEKKVAAVKPLDKPPTEAERLEHERTGHVPVRSWCSTCAELIGRNPKHNPVKKRRPGGIFSLDLAGPFEQGYAPVP